MRRLTVMLQIPLIRAVVSQRSVKDAYELQEMENTMTTLPGKPMFRLLEHIKPGNLNIRLPEHWKGPYLEKNCRMAYPIICTVNGQTLHNHYYGNELKKGQLLLIDAGAESPMRYATDITRTYPVGGKFTTQQKEIYKIVLKAQT